ncbi:MAG: DUF3459 domain-containing protein [Gammaproteobacteria bacterium]|nr:MAG: DUF3459 domain-containing protein [Gammaproteobacteria bacterium]
MLILSVEIMQRARERLAFLYGEARVQRLLDRLALVAARHLDSLLPPAPPASRWDASDLLLITYGDMLQRPGEAPLVTLRKFLDERVGDAIRDVHLLPIYPSSSDEGFSVIDYRRVDPALGSWEDVHALAARRGLMLDLVLNHVSRHSEWFKDYVMGIAPARHYFIEVSPETDLSAVVRPRSTPLLTPTQTRAGLRHVWTTFSEDQVDLNYANPDVLFEFLDILLAYVRHGARFIRLDAVGFLWKEIGTSCMHLPQTHAVVKLFRDLVDLVAPEVCLITETNVPHEENVSYFGAGDEAHIVYQFSLPPLLLHALLHGDARYLQAWARELAPPPSGCTFLNFTASHDGIGVRPLEGIVPQEEVDALVQAVRMRGGRVSMRSGPGGVAVPYELNITWFDALGEPGIEPDDRHLRRFLCSQAIMLSLQGIPAVYFHNLVGTRNDHARFERTGQPRALNRHRWNADVLERLLDDDASHHACVFREMLHLLRIRRDQPAFHPDTPQEVLDVPTTCFALRRESRPGGQVIDVVANLTDVPQQIGLDGVEGKDLLSGEEIRGGSIALAPYQVRWIARPVAREGDA